MKSEKEILQRIDEIVTEGQKDIGKMEDKQVTLTEYNLRYIRREDILKTLEWVLSKKCRCCGQEVVYKKK